MEKGTVHFRVDKDLIEWLDERAQKMRTNRTGVLVQLILRSQTDAEVSYGQKREAAGQEEEDPEGE